MKPSSFPAAQRGFTLIELMITVAIVAILAAVGYPAYTDQVAKGRRAEARQVLLEAAQWMERFYSENQRYDRNVAGVATNHSSLFYSAFKYVPKSTTVAGHYELELTVSNATPNAYTLTAVRKGAMATDKCGNFITNQTGARGIVAGTHGFGTDNAKAREVCWK